MYGAPSLGYGCEIVHSFNTLIDAIKRRQVLRPRSKLAINLAGSDIEVNLLANGFVGASFGMISIEILTPVLAV